MPKLGNTALRGYLKKMIHEKFFGSAGIRTRNALLAKATCRSSNQLGHADMLRN